MLFLEAGDATNPDLLFSENLGFEQASAVTCDGTQSSNLDLFLDPFELNARDLMDDFPGLGDLVSPLNELDAPPTTDVCRPRIGQRSSAKKGAVPQPGLQPLMKTADQYLLEGGHCDDPEYPVPLCCLGPSEGISQVEIQVVQGCYPC